MSLFLSQSLLQYHLKGFSDDPSQLLVDGIRLRRLEPGRLLLSIELVESRKKPQAPPFSILRYGPITAASAAVDPPATAKPVSQPPRKGSDEKMDLSPVPLVTVLSPSPFSSSPPTTTPILPTPAPSVTLPLPSSSPSLVSLTLPKVSKSSPTVLPPSQPSTLSKSKRRRLRRKVAKVAAEKAKMLKLMNKVKIKAVLKANGAPEVKEEKGGSSEKEEKEVAEKKRKKTQVNSSPLPSSFSPRATRSKSRLRTPLTLGQYFPGNDLGSQEDDFLEDLGGDFGD